MDKVVTILKLVLYIALALIVGYIIYEFVSAFQAAKAAGSAAADAIKKAAQSAKDAAVDVVTKKLNPASDENYAYVLFNTENAQGQVTDTLGTRIYDAVDTVKGWFSGKTSTGGAQLKSSTLPVPTNTAIGSSPANLNLSPLDTSPVSPAFQPPGPTPDATTPTGTGTGVTTPASNKPPVQANGTQTQQNVLVPDNQPSLMSGAGGPSFSDVVNSNPTAAIGGQ